MSFDVFVQGFSRGEAAALDEGRVWAALGDVADTETGLYGPRGPGWGCMFAGPSPAGLDAIARLVVEAGAVAFWPADVMTAVVGSDAKVADVPEAFERVLVVRTGADIAAAIGFS